MFSSVNPAQGDPFHLAIGLQRVPAGIGGAVSRAGELAVANQYHGFGPLLEIGSRESIREAVLRNIGISIIARQEVPHDPQLKVLTLENAPVISEYLYCLKERKSARLPAAFLGLAQEMAGC